MCVCAGSEKKVASSDEEECGEEEMTDAKVDCGFLCGADSHGPDSAAKLASPDVPEDTLPRMRCPHHLLMYRGGAR